MPSGGKATLATLRMAPMGLLKTLFKAPDMMDSKVFEPCAGGGARSPGFEDPRNSPRGRMLARLDAYVVWRL
jgi:hypothetical protein